MKKLFRLGLLCFLFLFAGPVLGRAEKQTTLRVGIFPLEPLNFIDDAGKAQGLNPDLLREIVRDQAEWNLSFVPVTWAEGLEKLQREEIDLMMSVAKTPERTLTMDYNRSPVIEVWGQVFIPSGTSVEHISELNGKRIGVMHKDISGENFIDLTKRFGVECEFSTYATHEDVFMAIQSGEVAAGVAPNHFGLQHGKQHHVKGSSIQFSPFSLFFAAKKGRQHEFLAEIDFHLGRWKQAEKSYYNKRVDYRLNGERSWAKNVPLWIWVGLGVIVFVAHALVFTNKLLDLKIKRRTEQWRASESQFGLLFENMHAGGAIYEAVDDGADFVLTDINKSGLKIAGKKREDVTGKRVTEVFPGVKKMELFEVFVRVWRTGASEDLKLAQYADGYIYSWIENHVLKLPSGRIVATYNDITARKQAEELLTKTEAKQAKMVANIGDVIVIIDQDGINRYKSPNITKWFGWKPEEVVGSSTLDNVHPEDVDRAREFIGDLMREPNRTGALECRYLCKDGTYKWIEFTGSNLSHDLDIQGILGNYHDITVRKQAEEEAIAYRNFMDSIPGFGFAKDINLTYVSANHTFCDLLKIPYDQIKGKTDYDIFPADLVGKYIDDDKRVIETRKPLVVEEVAFNANTNQRFIVATRKHPWFDENGNVIGVYGMGFDITEIKQAEAQKERLLAAINQAAETIVITDAAGTIEYVNPAFEKITGYACEEAIGQNSRMLQSGEHDDTFYQQMWNTLLRGETWSGRMVNKKKDGSLYTEEAVISPVKDAAGKTVDYVAVKRDVTEEIKLEEQFRQSQKMGSIGQLVGGVAHDFNNLLQIINGSADMAHMRMAKNCSPAENIDEITKAGARAKDLVRQLLAFSRQQVIDPVDLDLNEEIESTQKMLARLIGEHIQFQFIAGKDLSPVFSDKGQINQVLMNLCANARDAMPDGGMLTLKTESVLIAPRDLAACGLTCSGRYVLLSVTDTGCGMDKTICKKIFEPFFTTKEVGKGTGLGLSTVYGIVKQNEGHISVYSEPGEGTTFKIYLPVSNPLPAGVINSISGPPPPVQSGVETIIDKD